MTKGYYLHRRFFPQKTLSDYKIEVKGPLSHQLEVCKDASNRLEPIPENIDLLAYLNEKILTLQNRIK